MKQFFVLLSFLILFGCKEPAVKEPTHLIEREVMVKLLYDLSVLEVVKYQNPPTLKNYKKDVMAHIYKKYKIDSLQLVENNRYYAANYKDYKKMYEEIKAKVDAEVTYLDTLNTRRERKILNDSLKKQALKKKALLKAKKLKERLEKGAKDSVKGIVK